LEPDLAPAVANGTLDTKGETQMRLRVLTFAFVGLISAAAAEAGTDPDVAADAFTSTIRFSAEGPLQIERRGFAFPVIEYTDERGARQQRKGIIASKRITPDTLIGIGLFETTPKSRGYGADVPPNAAPRRSRKAVSIGFNWRF
jgi:hypothetical protein